MGGGFFLNEPPTRQGRGCKNIGRIKFALTWIWWIESKSNTEKGGGENPWKYVGVINTRPLVFDCNYASLLKSLEKNLCHLNHSFKLKTSCFFMLFMRKEDHLEDHEYWITSIVRKIYYAQMMFDALNLEDDVILSLRQIICVMYSKALL